MHDLTLPGESRVIIAGDWHGSTRWIQSLFPRIGRLAPEVRTILQLGDFGYWPYEEGPGKGYLAAVDYWCEKSGIERILVTPGNHEQWSLLTASFATAPGEMVQITEHTRVMPLGYRFRLGRQTFMSFGGAASYDRHHRTEGYDWFPEEMATQEQADEAASGDCIDVLLTHETISSPSPQVVREMNENRAWAPDEARERSQLSRQRVTQVFDYHHPARLFHGHMHTPDAMTLPDGRQVWSMGMDRQERNIGLLDLESLDFDWFVE